MKKAVLLVSIVAAAAAAAGFLVLQRHSATRASSAELVPAGTIIFAELPDIRESAKRWQGTALNELLQNPQMKAFLQKPLSSPSIPPEMSAAFDQVARISPERGFVAITSLDGGTLQFIAGLTYKGSRADVEALLSEPRKLMKEKTPAGKAEIVSYGNSEIQTFGDPARKDEVIAETFRDQWYFISNRVELMRATLDRYEGHPPADAPSLAHDPVFKKSIEPLPSGSDGVLYVAVGGMMDRFLSLMETAGQKPDPAQVEQLRKVTAFSASTKMEGKNFRDTIFVNSKVPTVQGALARSSMPLTSPDTFVYYAGAIPEKLEIPAATQAVMVPLLPQLKFLEDALSAKGVTMAEILPSIGPEYSVVVDWPAAAPQPSPLISLDVRNAEKSRNILEALTQLGGDASWKRSEEGDAVYYTAAPGGLMAMVAPCVAVNQKFILAGLSKEAVAAGLGRLEKKGPGLSSEPAFQSAEKSIVAPTGAFAYIDGKLAVERAYGLMRPLLAMSLAFNPAAAQYIDAGKLPTPEALAKPLGVTVYSQAARPDGTIAESVGPLTVNQAAIVVMGAVGVSTFSTLQKSLLQGGAGSLALPGIPSSTPPVGTPVAPTVPDPVAPGAEKPDAEKSGAEKIEL